MVGNILAGDQVGELGQHPGQSRSGDRHHGCRGVGGGGCERHAAHLRWLPRRSCPGDSANRQDLLEPSRGRPGLGGQSRIRQGKAVPGRQSACDPRPVSGPTVAVAVVVILALAVKLVPGVAVVVKLVPAVALAVELAQAVALAVELAQAVALAVELAQAIVLVLFLVLAIKLAQAIVLVLVLAVAFARVIPVGDAVMRTGLTWAAS